jgi:hypothetical protein
VRTEGWQNNMRGLRLVGKGESGLVSTNFGPLKVGLITTHKTRDQALSELLNSLEREVENLNSKYCEAYVTLVSVMEHLAKLSAIIINETTIDRTPTGE